MLSFQDVLSNAECIASCNAGCIEPKKNSIVNNNIIPEKEKVEDEINAESEVVVTKPKRQISDAQLEHLNNILAKALEKKAEMKEETLKVKLAKTEKLAKLAKTKIKDKSKKQIYHKHENNDSLDSTDRQTTSFNDFSIEAGILLRGNGVPHAMLFIHIRA